MANPPIAGCEYCSIIVFLFIVARLVAIEETPWIEPVLMPVLSLQGGYQHFNHYRRGSHFNPYRGRDFMLDGGLYYAPNPDASFQFETRLTKTRRHGWAIDQVKQTGHYVLLDDARGDPLAVTLGIALIKPMPVAVRDISFIHHAPFEIEFHATFGKEWALEQEWVGRIWGLSALGFGTRGSPWVRGDFTSEYRFCLKHIFGAKLCLEMGLGQKRLCSHHFRGYGDIAYRLADVTLAYTYKGDFGDFTFKYLRSLWRSNAPHPIQQFLFHLDIPFNL